MVTSFYPQVVANPRILNAFWKWSNFSDTEQNRAIFSYGTPPTIGLIDGSKACTYGSDGNPVGVLYGQTWSVNQIGINSSLCDLFVEAIAKPYPYPADAKQVIEAVQGTILHEMVHWSYYANGPVDEAKKYGGNQEYGTTRFELEAFGHPVSLPLNQLCKSKIYPYLGMTWDQVPEYSDKGRREVAVVKALDPTAPAAKAGIKVGDVIRKFDGEDIWPLPQGLAEQLLTKKPGEVARLAGYRSSTVNFDIDVHLVARPAGK
jgi:hypothetical protein